jgi:hypothetical protein
LGYQAKFEGLAGRQRDAAGPAGEDASAPTLTLYFTFAQVSFNVTVRLKTSVSSDESGSTEK